MKSYLGTANQRLTKLFWEVLELNKNLEFTWEDVKEETINIKSDLNQVKTKMWELGNMCEIHTMQRINWWNRKVVQVEVTFVSMELKKVIWCEEKYKRLSNKS